MTTEGFNFFCLFLFVCLFNWTTSERIFGMCCWKHFHQLSTWGLHNWEERVWGHAVFKYECNFFQNQVPWSSKSVCYLFFELSRVLIIETWYCSQLYGIFCKKNSLTLKTSDQSLSHMWAIPLWQFLNHLSLLFQFWTLLYVSLPFWDAAAQHHFFVPSVDEDFTFISNDGSATAAQRAKFTEKVHKPPLWVNFINFELNGRDASIWVPWSPSDPKKSWCTDRSIQIHKKQAAFLHLYRVWDA